jgi:hypothetical protein
MLSLVYATAIAVTLAHPGRATLGAVVVLAGLTARWVAHHRRSPATPEVVVLPPDAEPAVLRAAVLVTLADDHCRRAAGRLADEIRALDGPARAAEAVEQLPP